MSIIAIRSVTLSTKTADAWKAAGVRLARRGRSMQSVLDMGYSFVLNLGKSTFRPPRDIEVWNHGEDIYPLLYPGLTRELLDDLMPPRTLGTGDVWIKAPGAHGRGKYRKAVDRDLVLPREWDWCQHIEGQEYRIITVGHRVVQDFLRHGENGNRSYEWVRMREVPRVLKDTAREAARRIPGNNVIAWDMVYDGTNAYVFEGNTCPGVNEDTVRRIVTEMERNRNERVA